MTPSSSPSARAFRALPSVDELLREPEIESLAEGAGRDLVRGWIQEVLDGWRAEIQAGGVDAAGIERRVAGGEIARGIGERVAREAGRGVRRAINATGVVLHTGLGRAPVHPEAAEAMGTAARSYCVLEVDRFTGKRNQRDDRLSELLSRLTGAEAGIAVNNNAAAVLLVLQTFAAGREVVLSRGELVEIGGSFRVPDVMLRAGVRLVEVGTTNRTRIADYRAAAGPDTGLLMKVHTSNFRVEGFTEEVDGDELAELGRELSIPTAFDLGSGLLEGCGMQPLDMLGGEPLVAGAVASGLDAITFSGDKLLGGPQAGLVVGHAHTMRELRRNPMYRALRLDKVALAGLERTLELVLEGRGDEIPARSMMIRPAADIEPVARELASELDAVEGLAAVAAEDRSQPGSGSAPGIFLDTWVVRVRPERDTPDELASALRAGEPTVFVRIQDDEVLVDPRTLLPGDREQLVPAFRAAVGRKGGDARP